MVYKTFSWPAHSDPTANTRYRTLSAQFGDGYKQSVGDGVNNEINSWPLTFKGLEHEIIPIRDFLREHQGFKPFYWKPPLESEAFLFEVPEFSLVPLGGRAYTLTATFVQRFAP